MRPTRNEGKVMRNTLLLILRGQENTGKTRLCAEIYRQLLHYADKKHYFGNAWEVMKEVIHDSIEPNGKTKIVDFKALLSIKNKKVGIFSMGDYIRNDYTQGLQELIDNKVDILVCCTRSINRTNSTFRYLEEKYSEYRKEIFWTDYAEKIQDLQSVKQKQAKKITQFILNELIKK